MTKYHSRRTSGTSPWRDIGRRARPRLPTPCSSRPRPSTAAAASTTAPASPTTTRKNTNATSPSTPASCTSTTRASTSTCSTRPAIPTSSAPPSAPSTPSRPPSSSSRPSTASRSTPAACSTRPASAAWPACSSSTSSTATTSTSTNCSRRIRDTFGKGCVLFNAPINPGPKFSGVVSVLKPPAPAPAGCPVDLAAARSQLVDAIVEADEALMEKYLIEGDVSDRGAGRRPAARRWPPAPSSRSSAPPPKERTSASPNCSTPSPTYALSPVKGKHAHGDQGQRRQGRRGRPSSPTRTGEFVGQVFKTRHRQVRRQPELHPRLLRQATRPSSRWSTPAPASRRAPAACC